MEALLAGCVLNLDPVARNMEALVIDWTGMVKTRIIAKNRSKPVKSWENLGIGPFPDLLTIPIFKTMVLTFFLWVIVG